MAATLQLVWGTRVLDLTAGTPYKWTSINTSIPAPDALFTNPEYGEHQLLRLLPTDRRMDITLSITASTNTAVVNAITDLKLLVSGPYQIAANEDESPVYLKIDRTSNSRPMLHRVRFGSVSDGGQDAHFTPVATVNVLAAFVTVTLFLENAGIAATTIALKNALINGDFALAAAGLATSWTLIGAPTAANETTSFLINGRSQKITAASANLGLGSEDIAGVSSAAGYMWVRITSGSVVVALRDITGGTDLDNAVLDSTDSGGVSDKTAIDDAGNTWYRVPVSWSGSSTTVDLAARSSGGAATFFVDGAYLATGTTTVPNAWSSYYAISNRADRTTTNPTRVAHVDIWGVPGDMPAYLKTTFISESSATGNAKRLYYAKQTDARYPVCDAPYWQESDDMDYDTSGTGAWSDGTGTTNNHYKRFTEGAGGEGGIFRFWEFDDPDNEFPAFWSVPRRVFALCRTSNAAGLTITSSDTGETVQLNADNTWEMVDIGTVNRVGELNPAAIYMASPDLVTEFTIAGLANTETFDIDALIALPAQQDGLLIMETGYDVFLLGVAQDYITDGSDETAYINYALTGAYTPTVGNCWTIPPGHRTTRLIHFMAENDDEFSYAQEQSVTLTVTPRASLLLGHQTYLGGV